MKAILLTRGKMATVDDEDFEILSKFNWQVGAVKGSKKSGKFYYAGRWGDRNSDGKRIRISMSREITNCPEGLVVDHINGDSLDNRKENLRVCTQGQNRMNSCKRANSRSRFKGLAWNKRLGKWAVNITIHLGNFESQEEAAKVYDEYARKNYGEFAKLNFPEG